MAVLLVVTVGTRDLFLDGKPISCPRIEGEEILNSFKTYQQRLSYPIIRPVLEYLFQIKNCEVIDRLVLICTDQPESTDEKYRNQDTIAFAYILQRLIAKEWGKKIPDIQIFKISSNPTLLDEMYEFFEMQIPCNKKFQLEDLETCYIETSGGVPAVNTALLFQAIRYFKEKCCPLYVSEKTGNVIPLNIGSQLLEDYKKEIIKKFLEEYEYASISKILEREKTLQSSLYFLAEYARLRLYFDFEGARKAVQYGLQNAKKIGREIFEQAVLDIEKISQKDPLTLLEELYWNLWIKYHCREYVDFLGRLYRLQDALLRTAVEKWLGLDMTYDQATQSYKTFVESLERPEYSVLYEYLKTYEGPNKKPLVLYWVDIPVLTACLQFLAEKRGDENAKSLLELNEKIKPLIQLRHQTILAHGFTGVSEARIREKYPGDLLSEIKTLMNKIWNIKLEENPFDRINSWFDQLLKISGSEI